MKDFLLVRHGIAEDPAVAVSDAARRLTAEGRAVTDRLAMVLARCCPRFDLLVCSPLVRAEETADVLAARLVCDRRIVEPLLVPEASPQLALERLAARPEARVLIVGHEPCLSGIIGLALGCSPSAIAMPRSGACRLGFVPSVRPSAGVLCWHLDPAVLPG